MRPVIPPSPRKRWLAAMPWLILASGLSLTLAISAWVHWLEETLLHAQLEVRVDELIGGFRQRLESNAMILRGVAGLFDSSTEVTRAEFSAYVAGLDLARQRPGIQGIGFARLVPPAERARHVAAIRAEGFPDYDLRPPGARDPYTAIVYLEPFDWRNQRAFGYDMFSEPVRRAAMIRARDTGAAALTGRVTLVQETDQDVQAGLLLYVPIYRDGQHPDSIAARRAALLGWAYSPLRARDLIESYLAREFPDLSRQIVLRLYAGERPDPAQLLFASDAGVAPDTETDTEERLLFGTVTTPYFMDPSVVRATEAHGSALTFQVTPLPAFQATRRIEHGGLIVLGTGLAMSLVLALIGWILTRGHRRVEAALHAASHANRRLAEQKALLQAIYDSSGVAILLVSRDGIMTHANQRLAELFQQPLARLIGQRYDQLMPPAIREQVRQRFARLFESDATTFHLEQRFRSADGSDFWGQVVARAFQDRQGNIIGIVIVIEDITLRRTSEERIRYLAHHDYLTGLPNRALLMERAGQALAMARRRGHGLAILFIDLDRFKPINDTHGHDAGDLILRTLAARLHALLRESDTICRQGGDEFVILLPEFSDGEALMALARKLLAAIELPCQWRDVSLQVSASIGIAIHPEHGDTVETLIQRADDAMYAAKLDPDQRIHVWRAPS